ncbi:hypothetical protein B0J18DRAFT_420118 [Chaetomium sp. MPI-SDFR-AT-0129]|nr:hypothetical protein B0J18DRAFT_420118 [Chaetomium sp. MPI-SDFR-AT-0129]
MEADAACSGPQRARRSKGRSSDPVTRSKKEAAGREGMGRVSPRIPEPCRPFLSPLFMSLPTNEQPKQGNGKSTFNHAIKEAGELTERANRAPSPLLTCAAGSRPANDGTSPSASPHPQQAYCRSARLAAAATCRRGSELLPRLRDLGARPGGPGQGQDSPAGRCACRPAPKGVREKRARTKVLVTNARRPPHQVATSIKHGCPTRTSRRACRDEWD